MSTTQQPEALAADHSEQNLEMVARWYMIDKDGMATLCTDREDAEKEAKNANMAWPHTAPHRAVQLVEVADVEALRTGYAAARLEIESLRARGVGPDVSGYVSEWSGGLCTSDEAMDGIAKLYAAQPAGAQQPGTAYAELPDADRDYMRKVVAVAVTMLFDGHKEDVMRVFSTGELSEFVTITAAMRGEQVEDIYRRAWDLLSLPARASHGQAPAQAALAAQHETYGWQLVPIEVTDDMLAAFANCVSPEFGWNRATEAEHQEVRDSFGPAYRAMLAAAATHQADSQPAVDALAEAEYFIDNPSAWSNFDQRASDAIAAVCRAFRAARATADSVTAPVGGETYHLGACIVEDMLHATVMRKEPGRAGAVTVLLSEQIPVEHLQDRDVIVNATPPAQAADSVLEDAARYRYLRDGDWREHEKLESVIRLQLNTLWDETIDAARAAQEDKSHGRDA